MDYGYSRCSTNETKQDINRQVRELKAAGAVEIFMEYEHGDAKVKSQQAQMFAQAQAGDIALVQRLLQHSSASTTQRYIGIEPQRIEAAIEGHANLI